MGIYEKERKLEKGEREEKLHWRRERKRYGNRWEERNLRLNRDIGSTIITVAFKICSVSNPLHFDADPPPG